jgi:hypothetical protein
MIRRAMKLGLGSLLMLFIGASPIIAEDAPVKVQVHWDKVIRVSKTNPSLLFVATPKTRRGAPLHDSIFKALGDLRGDDVRYAPSKLYPHFAVAELKPPTKTETFWDFSQADPITDEVMETLKGHPPVLKFSAIPAWMFETAKPVDYPADPDLPAYDYGQGRELRDPTFHEVADYFARVVSWHVNGGFTDELGKWHASGHHYKVDYWEVLNEPDIEHGFSQETYTKIYDAVVEAVRKVAPQMKFVGISSSSPGAHPEFFDYFLDPRHHKPGIPLDMISYHFYAVPGIDEPVDLHPFTFFDQADRFLEVVGFIETIRKRLSPATGTMVNEIGTMMPEDWSQGDPGYVYKPVPASYWNLSAAVYAYIFTGLARMGIDAANESMIPAYPGRFPSIAMLDWDTGKPNARFLVLKLIHDNFPPGDKIVETQSSTGNVFAQAFVSPRGERKLLLVNKRDREFHLVLPEAAGGSIQIVDQSTGEDLPPSRSVEGQTVDLPGLAVAVVTLAK